MNLLTIAGRLGRDAELKETPAGKAVVNFAVAVDIGRGENKQTLWVDCSLWGDRASKLAPYLTKGKQVTLAGDVGLRTFTKKDGSSGAAMTCDVQRLTLQGGRDAEQPPQTPAPAAPARTRPPTWGLSPEPRPAPPSEADFDADFDKF